jgi:hypothetical protein
MLGLDVPLWEVHSGVDDLSMWKARQGRDRDTRWCTSV